METKYKGFLNRSETEVLENLNFISKLVHKITDRKLSYVKEKSLGSVILCIGWAPLVCKQTIICSDKSSLQNMILKSFHVTELMIPMDFTESMYFKEKFHLEIILNNIYLS